MDIDALPLISADSHIEEPETFFYDALPASLRDRLPPSMRPHVDIAGEFGGPIGVEGETPTTRAKSRSGYDLHAKVAQARANEVSGRMAVMIEDGVRGECIYPTRGLAVWMTDVAEIGRACCEIYNDWIADTLGSRSARFRCAGMIPTWNVDEAVTAISHTGAAPLLWGNDFPHAEGTYPHSRKIVRELMGGLGSEDAARIAGGTAAELFRFDPDVLETVPV